MSDLQMYKGASMFTRDFGGTRVAQFFKFYVLLFFVLFPSVLCLVYPVLPSVSGLPILDCPFDFL